MLTTKQVRNKTKDVTRRLGWWFLKPGDVVMAVEKGQGLKRGEKVVRLGPIRIKSTFMEPLNGIAVHGWREVHREGFPRMTVAEFITMFCVHNKCTPDKMVNRIEFEYLE